MGEKILVGMSGGVDSAVAALLLMKQGYQVSGCTLRLRGGRLASIGNGNGETEIEDARTVCRTLGIEHLVLDLSDRFCRQVVDAFAEEYRRGRTPNPCVVCNRTIKFGGMLDYARQQGYDAIGHRTLCPPGILGGREAMAALPGGQPQRSELCAVRIEPGSAGTGPFSSVRTGKGGGPPPGAGEWSAGGGKGGQHGNLLRSRGRTRRLHRTVFRTAGSGGGVRIAGWGRLSPHGGISRYTVGQRKGLGVALGRPAYVSAIRADTGEIQLSYEPPFTQSFTVSCVNYVSIPEAEEPFRAQVKIRYQAPPARRPGYPAGTGTGAGPFRPSAEGRHSRTVRRLLR